MVRIAKENIYTNCSYLTCSGLTERSAAALANLRRHRGAESEPSVDNGRLEVLSLQLQNILQQNPLGIDFMRLLLQLLSGCGGE